MIILSVILTISAFGAAPDGCSEAGEKHYNKFPDADVTFSGAYAPMDGYNLTKLNVYYPDKDTFLQQIDNTNDDLAAALSFETDEFSLEPLTSYLVINSTQANSTDGADTAYECEYITVTAPDSSSSIIPVIIFILVAATMMIMLMVGFGEMWMRMQGEEKDFSMIGWLGIIIGLVIIIFLLGAFTNIFM